MFDSLCLIRVTTPLGLNDFDFNSSRFSGDGPGGRRYLFWISQGKVATV